MQVASSSCKLMHTKARLVGNNAELFSRNFILHRLDINYIVRLLELETRRDSVTILGKRKSDGGEAFFIRSVSILKRCISQLRERKCNFI